MTHGGLQNTRWKYGPAWQAQAAAVLRSQGYDAVIAYNWVAASNHPGRAAMQGPRLARQILATASQFPASDPVDLHFIGHSEGAVVNTQAIVSLESMMTPQLNAGYIKDTLLDPHAANNAVPGQQYSLTSGPTRLAGQGGDRQLPVEGQGSCRVHPRRVNDAEVFYQHTSAAKSHGVNSGIYNLWGQVPVKGSAHYYNLTAAGATHAGETGVSQWYTNFVAPTLGDQAPLIRSLQLDGQVARVDSTTVGGRRTGCSRHAARVHRDRHARLDDPPLCRPRVEPVEDRPCRIDPRRFVRPMDPHLRSPVGRRTLPGRRDGLLSGFTPSPRTDRHPDPAPGKLRRRRAGRPRPDVLISEPARPGQRFRLRLLRGRELVGGHVGGVQVAEEGPVGLLALGLVPPGNTRPRRRDCPGSGRPSARRPDRPGPGSLASPA